MNLFAYMVCESGSVVDIFIVFSVEVWFYKRMI